MQLCKRLKRFFFTAPLTVHHHQAQSHYALHYNKHVQEVDESAHFHVR